jgi:hypothetical protein
MGGRRRCTRLARGGRPGGGGFGKDEETRTSKAVVGEGRAVSVKRKREI